MVTLMSFIMKFLIFRNFEEVRDDISRHLLRMLITKYYIWRNFKEDHNKISKLKPALRRHVTNFQILVNFEWWTNY